MTAKTEPLLLRVKDVEVLQAHVELLQELSKELDAYNPRNTPLKFNTKERWGVIIQEACEYFQRFLPKE